MNTQHFEKGFTLSDRLRVVIARKVGKLATYCEKLKDEASFIRIEAEQRETKKKQDQVKVMVTISLPHKTFRSESRRAKVIEATDRAIAKLTPQLKRYKERQTGRERAHEFARRAA